MSLQSQSKINYFFDRLEYSVNAYLEVKDVLQISDDMLRGITRHKQIGS